MNFKSDLNEFSVLNLETELYSIFSYSWTLNYRAAKKGLRGMTVVFISYKFIAKHFEEICVI